LWAEQSEHEQTTSQGFGFVSGFKGGQLNEPATVHTPVLLEKLLGLLSYSADAVVVDATVGHAGHALALAERLNEKGLLVGLDVDADSFEVSRRRLEQVSCRVELKRENFGRVDVILEELAVGQVDVIVADLGVGSGQLADAARGISFQIDGPLDMRFDDRLDVTAADLVNKLGQEELADLIYRYSQERKSRRIAQAIVEARRTRRLQRTGELVDVIFGAMRIVGKGRKSKIHPATRTFQSLRIAVNDELGQLKRLLEMAPRLLRAGGQVAIISFHSLEDRLVKYNFRENKQAGIYEILTRKPVIAGEQERKANPRSRSAKLRVAQKVGGDVKNKE
jgi:16S rRNA (cytosine1402-N4)-methyltransferase